MSSPVFFFDHDDPQMIQACLAAQATFKYFWREVWWERRRIVPGLGVAVVKLPFSDGPDSQPEHMWVNDVDFDGEIISGNLMNQPNWVKSVRQGDAVSVPFAHLEDWMFSIGDKAYGAHTVNCMRSRMKAAERTAHDTAWGLDFGDPSSVRLQPWEDKASASAAPGKPGLLSRIFNDKNAPSPAPSVEHRDHPMCVNVMPKIEAQLQSDAASYLGADEHGWTLLHREALAGNLGVVKLLVQYGADAHTLTPGGKSAGALAAANGWPAIEAFLNVA